MAQQSSSSNPQSPAGSSAQGSPAQSSDTQTNKSGQSSKEATSSISATQSGSMSEMKTKTFKGTLMDASCAGVQGASSMTAATTGNPGTTAAPGTPSNPATPATPGSETQSPANRQAGSNAQPGSNASGTANRSAGEAATGSCTVSSSTSAFAMKLDDGRTLPFDMVGNERAKEQIQKNKKWSEAASSGKPIHAKVSGVESGEKLVVSSIH